MKYIITLLILFSSFLLQAQDYFWVGGSGNWADYASHWATTSGGSTFHTSAPSSANDVYFDANSFSESGQIVTIAEEANCFSMDWTGAIDFPSLISESPDVNIYGSLTLIGDMTLSLKDLEFESTTSGNTITSNGTIIGDGSRTRFNGIGGEWSLMDNFDTDNIYFSAGTLNTNNNSINAGVRFTTSGSSAKVLNLGSSEITADRWWITGTNHTINAGTSKIFVSSFYSDTSSDGPFDYYDVEFYNYGRLRQNASFNEITVAAGIELLMQAGDVFTVNSFVAAGSKHEMIVLGSETEGVEATINQTSGTVDVSYVEISDIQGAGGAIFSATSSIDNGNNTGWTIAEISGMDYYWVGDEGVWTDFTNHWATTSGGSTMHTDYPDKLDDVYFDESSFTMTGQTVSQDLDDGAKCANMDWTGVSNSPTFSAPYSFPLRAYGSVAFVEEMSKSMNNLDLYGEQENHTLDLSGGGSISFLSFYGDGAYDLLSDINCGSLRHFKGTVNYNAVMVNCSIDFDIGSGSSSPVLNLGSAEINCRDLTISGSSSPVMNFGTSSFTVKRELQGSEASFYEVRMDGTTSVLSGNTFEYFTVAPGSSLQLEEGVVQTINQGMTLSGTKTKPINLSSTLSGSQSTIFMAGGTVDASYLVLQDIEATGGATFNASETVDNGNNTGWNITALASLDYYWVGESGNWSDFENHWVTTSGGSIFHDDLPGVLDNVFFDANSFLTTGQIVTVDLDAISFHDMDWTGVTNDPVFDAEDMNVYGSLDFVDGVSVSLSDCFFLSDETETITVSEGQPGTNSYFHFTGTGTWTLQSPLTVRELNHHSGSIDINGQDLHIDFALDFHGSDVKSMTLGASDFFTRSMSIGSAENLTFDGSTSSITTSSTFSTLEYSGTNSWVFNDLTFIRYNSTDEGRLHNDMTLNTLTFDANTTMELRADITITVNELVAVGTSEDPIIIYSLTEGNAATISQPSGTVDGYFLEMQDLTVTGGATFNAYSSIDNGNVSGWTFFKSSQAIEFPELSDVVFGEEPIELMATATSGLEISYSVISGSATIDGNTLTITGAGIVQVQASQSGDIDFDPAPSVSQSFEVFKANQIIILEEIEDVLVIDGSFELSASGGDSGNPIVFTSSDELVATVSGSTVTIIGEGSATIFANQIGNDDYNAASEVQQSFLVTKTLQEIVFEELAAKTYGDDSFELSAVGGESGNTVTFVSSDENVVSVSGTTVTILGVGSATITASQLGDDSYEAAIDIERSLTVGKTNLTITADDFTISQGDDLPLFTMIFDGFVYEDNESDITRPSAESTTTDSQTPGVFDITLTGGSADNYDLTLVNGTLTIEAEVLGVSPLENEMITIYPNPAINAFSLKESDVEELRIFNINGKRVKSFTGIQKHYDISDLHSGVYIVLLQTKSELHKYRLTKI